MKKVYKLLSVLTISGTLFLSSCGTGGGGGNYSSSINSESSSEYQDNPLEKLRVFSDYCDTPRALYSVSVGNTVIRAKQAKEVTVFYFCRFYRPNRTAYTNKYYTILFFSYDRNDLDFDVEGDGKLSEIKNAEVEGWKPIYYVYAEELTGSVGRDSLDICELESRTPYNSDDLAKEFISKYSFSPVLRTIDALPDLEIYEHYNRYYSIVKEQKSWLDAERYCEEIGGHLITNYLRFPDWYYGGWVNGKGYINNKPTWVGLYRSGNNGRITTGNADFYWVNGKKYNSETDSKFHYGQPDNAGGVENAAQLIEMDNQYHTTTNYLLNDAKQDTLCYFACQWDDDQHFGKITDGYHYQHVSNQEELVAAMNDGTKEIYFTKDIRLDDSFIPYSKYANVIDGKNHKLYISSTELAIGKTTNFIDDFEGTLKNVEIEIEVSAAGEFDTLGGVINTNKGRIENVVVNGTIDAEQVSNVGGIVGKNSGVLDNVISNVHITGKNKVGGIAGSIESGGTYNKLINNGFITGEDYVGGVAGFVSHSADIVLNDASNFGEITGESNVGGIFGRLSLDGSALINAKTLINEGTINGESYIGGIIGYGSTKNNNSHIDDASSSGTINASYYAGGVAGYLSSIILNKPSNYGSTLVIAECGLDDEGYKISYVGGIAGYSYIINEAINELSIIADGKYVGGIAGYATGNISKSANKGDITCESDYAGGIAGYATNVNDCTDLSNDGDIIGKNYVGGIYGYHSYVAGPSYTMAFKTLTNSGDVLGADYVGGIIGYSLNNATNKNALATVKVDKTDNTGDVTGKSHVGGLFGYISATNAESSYLMNSTSKNCTVTGDGSYIGGLVGEINNILMNQCSNEGMSIVVTETETSSYIGGYAGKGYAFTNLTNFIEVLGGSYVGGIAGHISGLVSDCENNGNITSTGMYVGGIAGMKAGISSPIQNLTNTGDISGSNIVGGIFGGASSSVNNAYTIVYSKLGNTGSVQGVNLVGGIIGNLSHEATNKNANALVQLSRLTDSGNVVATGENALFGGLIGYGYSDDGNSYITVSSCTYSGLAKYGSLVNIVDKDAE